MGEQSSVPESATLAIIGLGLAGLGYARRRQQMSATAA
ncbi:MAG: PEP-CTERM sorting domain-containing protein [Planctomycetaceae bacterium]|nr:PEP-CTERM sorting domain-containing protein [Planctomycetaceae bacterium]